MQVNISEDLTTQIQQLEKVLELLEKVKSNNCLNFIGIKELSEATGWSKPTVENLFNRPDFPSCDFGKEKKAELTAVINYFSVPRRKSK